MTEPEHCFRHHPLLGTVVDVRIGAVRSRGDAEALDRLVVDEMTRLQSVFSAFDPHSELERWKRGELHEPSPELYEVLALGLEWQRRSDGAFNPAAGVVSAAWRAAEAAAAPPDDELLARLAESIREPRYAIDADGSPVPTGRCSQLDLNAFAKGWIVDRAAELACHARPEAQIVVNAGGDLVHRGTGEAQVGIENPLRPYDNEPPIATITIADAGLATSGRARRGFRIGGRWYAHVIDPRTGRTVEHIASISVVAPTAAEVDAVATIAGLMTPQEAVDHCQALGLACFVVDDTGTYANQTWSARFLCER